MSPLGRESEMRTLSFRVLGLHSLQDRCVSSKRISFECCCTTAEACMLRWLTLRPCQGDGYSCKSQRSSPFGRSCPKEFCSFLYMQQRNRREKVRWCYRSCGAGSWAHSTANVLVFLSACEACIKGRRSQYTPLVWFFTRMNWAELHQRASRRILLRSALT